MGALLRVFSDVYTPSFVGVYVVVYRILLIRGYGIYCVGTNAYTSLGTFRSRQRRTGAVGEGTGSGALVAHRDI